ncbi:zinc metalloprotease HtpX [Candidatus Parcubacteria bacterium]|jgi:heat shock protein HtpX|nr:MAG: zinc metalloprotease HtpX [Candidatus Parcubacteria bacterium]
MTTYNQISSNKRKSLFLIAIFVIIIVGLAYVFSRAYEAGTGYVVLAIIFSLFMTLIGYFSGDKIALWTAGAVPIKKEDNPYVYRLVENLCITAGLPLPKIYIIPEPMINAFATGRNPERASIAITQGAIEKLENEELEGVIAHELSHVGNYDVRFMTLVAVLVGIISLLANWFIRINFFGGRRSDSRGGNIGQIFFLVGIILSVLAPIAAVLIQLSVSRKREFLADASGAQLTRYPEGLARALEKIGQQEGKMRGASTATAHLFIANPFGAHTSKGLSHWFSTHPPVEERIKILRSM